MAIIDNLALPQGYYFILNGASIQTGYNVGGNGSLVFGSIAKIYATSDKFSVGQNVAYNPEGSQVVGYSNYQYALVEESKILYSEGFPV
jgi:hypothetical protein